MRKRGSEALDLQYVGRALFRTCTALLCAGVAYTGWLTVSLLTAGSESVVLQTIRWLFAPSVTATGFAVGIVLSERIAATERSKFVHTLVWPLIGCAIGAGAVYWRGPMLIVFGMFAVGTASIVLREVILYVTRNRHDSRGENK